MKFRVRTWNCFGMAQETLSALFARRATAGERLRHRAVVEECSDADVLCTQEIMSTDAERFFDGLERFSARHRDHNRFDWRTGTVRGAGLGIGTRSKPLSLGVRHFSRPAVGWDRFARKGAMFVRVPVAHGLAADVLTLHLQNGDDPTAKKIRMQQVESLPALVAEVGSDERPFVIAGDFNIQGLARARGEEYARMRATLEGFEDLGAVDDLPTFDPHDDGNALARAFNPDAGPLRIDYVLYRPARRGPKLRVRHLKRFLDRPLAPEGAANGDRVYASDHYGLCAELELE